MTSARTRAKTARIQAYQEAILEAAERLFAERGIDATKMEDIALEAGLSTRTLYAALEGAGKAEVVSRIRRARLASLVEFAASAAASEGSALERLREAFEKATEFFLAHSDYLRMHMREGYAWGIADAVSAHSAESRVSFREGVGAIVTIVADGRARGEFDIERPERTASSIVTLQQVHLAEWVDDGEKDSLECVFGRFWSDAERLLGV